jgi:hypothetical protein
MKSSFCLAALLLASPSLASAATFVADVSGARSVTSIMEFGDNTVFSYQVEPLAHITRVSWNVTITAFDPSVLADAALQITGSDAEGPGAVVIPGRGAEESGTASFVGGFDLVANDLDFVLGSDGILRLEFFEGYEDWFVVPNAIWDSGTVTFEYTAAVAGPVPEPASWATMMLGFGVVGAALRRRRSRVVI